MQQFDHIVQSPEGIHAKPAMMLAALAKSIRSRVTVSYDGKKADARNIMALFTLKANQGAKVTFTVNGHHEIEDLELLKDFCKKNI